MFRTMFSGKIHRATVTDANLHYEGSVTIDKVLIKAANMIPYEKVQIVNINNGARFETYIIPGKENSGIICLNGAASRMAEIGDKVIIISYISIDYEAAKDFSPKVVLVNENNKMIDSITNKD